jgi:hypothetical protein
MHELMNIIDLKKEKKNFRPSWAFIKCVSNIAFMYGGSPSTCIHRENKERASN